jgi:hypothetical protein
VKRTSIAGSVIRPTLAFAGAPRKRTLIPTDNLRSVGGIAAMLAIGYGLSEARRAIS